MTTHTPGPWKVYRAKEHERFGVYAHDAENEITGVIVALGELDDWGGTFNGGEANTDTPTCDIGEANAHLMAASPDMHAALLAFVKLYDLWVELDAHKTSSTWDKVDALKEKVDFALHKANQGPEQTDTTDLKSQSDLIAALAVQLETPK